MTAPAALTTPDAVRCGAVIPAAVLRPPEPTVTAVALSADATVIVAAETVPMALRPDDPTNTETADSGPEVSD
jgi:hypothetical protein